MNNMNNENKYGENFNYDIIANLPIDKSIPTESELIMLNTLFKDKEKKSIVRSVINEAYEPFFVGILFVLLSIPQLDEFIKSNIQITQNSLYFLLLFKMFIIMILFWIIKHFHLCKK